MQSAKYKLIISDSPSWWALALTRYFCTNLLTLTLQLIEPCFSVRTNLVGGNTLFIWLLVKFVKQRHDAWEVMRMRTLESCQSRSLTVYKTMDLALLLCCDVFYSFVIKVYYKNPATQTHSIYCMLLTH